MTIYVGTAEIEAMQWNGHQSDWPVGLTALTTYNADQMVSWVIANGGEARYEQPILANGMDARIMVRTKDGREQPCAPGGWIVKGSEMFDSDGRNEYGSWVLDHLPVRDLSEVRLPLTWEPKS